MSKEVVQNVSFLWQNRVFSGGEIKMAPAKKKKKLNRRGAVLIVSMIFVLIFSALAVSMATMSNTNVQLASNQHKANSALSAAQSGIECGKYIISTISLGSSGLNYITLAQANQAW